MKALPIIQTPHLLITVLKPEDYKLLAQYQDDNRLHLQPWEPQRTASYYRLAETQKRVAYNYECFRAGTYIPLVGIDKKTHQIICSANFSNIVYGVLQGCHLGYSVAEKAQGKGIMFEMLDASIKYVFDEYQLHRIMANYIPTNRRSGKLLKRLGFELEGLAKSYLKIAGVWQDHVLTSKLNQ